MIRHTYEIVNSGDSADIKLSVRWNGDSLVLKQQDDIIVLTEEEANELAKLLQEICK